MKIVNMGRAAVAAVCLGVVAAAHGQETIPAAPPNARVVEVGSAYLDVIQQLARLARPASREPRFAELEALCKCTFAGELNESLDRTTYIFRDGTGPILAVTSWRYERSGASLHFGPGALNDSIEGSPASTALAVAKGAAGGLWKITWVDGASGDRRQVELYVRTQNAVAADVEKVRRYAASLHRAFR